MEIFNTIDKTLVEKNYIDQFQKLVLDNEYIFKNINHKFSTSNVTPFLECVISNCLNKDNIKIISKFYNDLILFIDNKKLLFNKIIDSSSDELSSDDNEFNDLEEQLNNEINDELVDLDNKFINLLSILSNKNDKVCSKWIDSNNNLMLIDICNNCSFFRSNHQTCKKYDNIINKFECDTCGLDKNLHNVCAKFEVENYNDNNYLNRKNDVCTTCGLSREKHYKLYNYTHCKLFETNEYGSCKNCIFDFQSHLNKNSSISLNDLKKKVKICSETNDLNLLSDIQQNIKKSMNNKMKYIKTLPVNFNY